MFEEREARFIPSSWGVIRLELSATGIVGCALPHLTGIPKDPFSILDCGKDPYSTYVRLLLEGGTPVLPEIGTLQGSEFQQKVWGGLLSIPRGETLSYKTLAERIGSPAACRAVANACGKNPVPLFVPCHRVIGADGNLGGFSAGLPWKRLLLGVEQLKRS